MTATKKRVWPSRPGRPILSVLVDRETKAEVHRLAGERGVPISDVIREGISMVVGVTGDGEDAAVVIGDGEVMTNRGEERGEPP